MPRKKRHRSRFHRLIRYLANNPAILLSILELAQATVWLYALRLALGLPELALRFAA